MVRDETEEYLPFKKVDQRKLRDEAKKVNADRLKQMIKLKRTNLL